MKRLNEKEIIKIINSKHVSSEDVEIFNLGNEQCAVCVDTLVESTDIPKGSKLSDISRKSIVSSVSDFAAKGIEKKYKINQLDGIKISIDDNTWSLIRKSNTEDIIRISTESNDRELLVKIQKEMIKMVENCYEEIK